MDAYLSFNIGVGPMVFTTSRRTPLLLACVLVSTLLLSNGGIAPQARAEGDAKIENKKKRAKPRGRLPAHYRNVVTPEQRKSIYEIQAKYAAQIKALKDQITALKAKQSTETEAVLTDAQKKKIAELVTEAKAKRKKGA